MPLKIVVVEDDHLDREWIYDELRKYFSDAAIELIVNEKDFKDQLPRLAQSPPDVFIIDIMLRWNEPIEGEEITDIPVQVQKDGYYTAGLRCLSYVTQFETLRGVPHILYTGLDINNFPGEVIHMKTDDISSLIGEIRKQLRKNESR